MRMGEEKPPACWAYDIPFPREQSRDRARTCSAVDTQLWKARRSLLGEHNSDIMAAKPMSSEANSLAGSWETLSECECFPPALCVYDIPLPCGHFRSWEEVCSDDVKDVRPLTRKRSVTLPTTDLKALRLKKIASKNHVCNKTPPVSVVLKIIPNTQHVPPFISTTFLMCTFLTAL